MKKIKKKSLYKPDTTPATCQIVRVRVIGTSLFQLKYLEYYRNTSVYLFTWKIQVNTYAFDLYSDLQINHVSLIIEIASYIRLFWLIPIYKQDVSYTEKTNSKIDLRNLHAYKHKYVGRYILEEHVILLSICLL